ncbi:MAG: YtxH domain-containing protein [Candidatus Eiseniibacteriota bacterium]
MTYDPNFDTMAHNGRSSMNTFLLGALAGAGVALLFSPWTGRETRSRLGNSARKLQSGARGAVEGIRENIGGVKEGLSHVNEGVKEAVAAGKQAYVRATQATPSPSSGTGQYGA